MALWNLLQGFRYQAVNDIQQLYQPERLNVENPDQVLKKTPGIANSRRIRISLDAKIPRVLMIAYMEPFGDRVNGASCC